MLFFGESLPISREDFLGLCREQLSKQDFLQLQAARIDSQDTAQADCPVIRQMWRKWEVSLRNELAKLRGQEKNKDPEPYLIESEEVLGHFDLAKEAVSNTSPTRRKQPSMRRGGTISKNSVQTAFLPSKALSFIT